jgi:hypothetical protein
LAVHCAKAFAASTIYDPPQVALDSAGNAIIASYNQFAGLDLGGGPLGYGTFVAKFDASCNYAWSYNDSNGPLVTGLAVDASDNVVFVGHDNAGQTAYVTKLDSNGNLKWSHAFASGYAGAKGVAIDSSGNIVVLGYFSSGTINFGGATFSAVTDEGPAFLARFDSNGNHLWSTKLGSNSGGLGPLNGIALDSANDIYVTGNFSTSIDLGGGSMTNADGSDGFAAKLRGSDAGFVWQHQFTSTTGNKQVSATMPALVQGRLLVTGVIYGTVDFGDGPRSPANYGPYFLALDPSNGNTAFSRVIDGDVGPVSATGSSFVWTAEAPSSGTFAFGSGKYGVALIDPNGNTTWSSGYGAGIVTSIRPTPAGGLLMGLYAGNATVDFGLGQNTTGSLAFAFFDP